MSRISVDVSSARIPVLQVGYQGENEVTDVLFDISSWITEFGEGVAQLRVKRPGNSEEESYVLSLTITDGIAVWTVSETDTFNKGNGKVQLSYMVGNIVKKAVIYPYKVGKSIVGADNPVDPFDSWIERSKAWAIGKTLDGGAVPETDETYQNNAKYYAEQADILGSAQVVLATEKADAAAASETNAAASEAAVNGVSTQLTTRMSAIETEQSVQSARMDTFTSLPEGSTSGNAELADIRVGAAGTTYDTAGNAVRGQIGELKSDINDLGEIQISKITKESEILTENGTRGYINSNGSFSENSGYRTFYFAMPKNGQIWFDTQEYFCRIGIYNGNLFDANVLEFYGAKSNETLPYEESKLSVQKGQLVVITIQTNVDHNFSLNLPIGFILKTSQKELVKQYIGIDETLTRSGVPADAKAVGDLIKSTAKKPKCIYRATSVESGDSQIYYSDKAKHVLSVFIPSKKGYVQYNFGESASGTQESGGYNVGRMCVLYAANDDLTKRFDITRPGEWEMAVKISGEPDFIGGYEHGDEWQTEIEYVIDGEIINDITSITDYMEFTELRIKNVSNMYLPTDHATLVGIHGREWIFTENDVILKQSIQWKFTSDTEMTASYLTMLPLIRGNDTISEKQITSKFFDDIDFSTRDCSTYGFDGNMSPDVRKMTVYSKESGVFASVEVMEYPYYPNSRYNYLMNGENKANKMYFGVCGYGSTKGTVVPNQVWKQKSIYKIEICEGVDEPDVVIN